MTQAAPSTDRRRFLQFFSASGLAGTLFPGVLWARWQQEPESPITAEMIAEAEKIAGLELNDQEREMMRGGLARNLEAFEKIRQLQIPNEVPPALVFEPVMPGVQASPATAQRPLREI